MFESLSLIVLIVRIEFAKKPMLWKGFTMLILTVNEHQDIVTDGPAVFKF